MDIQKSFKEIIEKTSLLKVPQRKISTFGNTRIKYFFVSEVPGMADRSRLREGLVIAESPKIITPDFMKNRFEGFGEDSAEFDKWLSDKYGAGFRALQYRFKNEFQSSRVEYQPIRGFAKKMAKELEKEGSHQSALIQGPDETWSVSMMKFIVDECMRSFSDNVREMDEHGLFASAADIEEKTRQEIENLFVWAKKDRAALTLLGKKLRESGFFKDYEDRFFSLVPLIP